MGRKKNKKNRSSSELVPLQPPKPEPPRQSLLCIRIFILVLLAGFTSLSIYVLHSLTTLSHQIDAEDKVIQSLRKKVSDQQLIIDRFNNSVTNTDVLQKVNNLEQSLHRTEHDMQESLNHTTSDIQSLLDKTVATLDQTVVAAQNEIHHEVDLVKGDVEQYVRTTQDQFSMENSFMVYQIAGTFTLVACLISMWHMTAHIRFFKRPFVQRKILAILWMSPIYSVTSWLCLVFPKYEGILGILKDFYEAYVIYQFLSFCISVLGRGDREKVVELLAHHADHLEPPVRFFGWCRGEYTYPSAKALADAVLLQCQIFAMQFVFFKPMTSIGMFACNDLDWGGVGESSTSAFYRRPQFWINIVQNISVFMAFSGLLKFYHAVQDDLAWCRPFPKFLCIKGIVFMTFWQGLVIAFLASRTSIAGAESEEEENNDKDLWGKQAQNFLICLEMLLFSIAHFYCFPTEEWREGYRPAVEKQLRLGDNMAFGDFMSDLKLIMGGGGREKKAKIAPSKKDVEEANGGLENGIVLDEETPSIMKKIMTDIHEIESGPSDDAPTSIHDHDESESSFDPNVTNDTVGESFDLEQLSSRIDSSVRESLLAEDVDIREAANRLQEKMNSLRQIEEGNEDESKPPATNFEEVASYGSYDNEIESKPSPTIFDNVREAANTLQEKMQSLTQMEERNENESKLYPTIFKPEASYGACEHDNEIESKPSPTIFDNVREAANTLQEKVQSLRQMEEEDENEDESQPSPSIFESEASHETYEDEDENESLLSPSFKSEPSFGCENENGPKPSSLILGTETSYGACEEGHNVHGENLSNSRGRDEEIGEVASLLGGQSESSEQDNIEQDEQDNIDQGEQDNSNHDEEIVEAASLLGGQSESSEQDEQNNIEKDEEIGEVASLLGGRSESSEQDNIEQDEQDNIDQGEQDNSNHDEEIVEAASLLGGQSESSEQDEQDNIKKDEEIVEVASLLGGQSDSSEKDEEDNKEKDEENSGKDEEIVEATSNLGEDNVKSGESSDVKLRPSIFTAMDDD